MTLVASLVIAPGIARAHAETAVAPPPAPLVALAQPADSLFAAELARSAALSVAPAIARPLPCVRLIGSSDAIVPVARLAAALGAMGMEVIVDLRGEGAPSWPIVAPSASRASGAMAPTETLVVRVESGEDAIVHGLRLAGAGGTAAAPAASAASARAPAAEGTRFAWEGQLRYRYEMRSVLDYRLPGTFKRPATQRLGEAGDVSLMRTRLGSTLALVSRSGAGKAFRSTLPFGVRGNASSVRKIDGTMYSGSCV